MTTIREAYEKMGGNFEETVARLTSEAFVQRFAGKFLDDPSFNDIKQALTAEDAELAFRAAHTLKGVCQNLGFANLYQPASDLTEVLRGGSMEGFEEPWGRVQQQYEITIAALKEVA